MTPQEAVKVLRRFMGGDKDELNDALFFSIRAIEENKELREALEEATHWLNNWPKAYDVWKRCRAILAKHKEGR